MATFRAYDPAQVKFTFRGVEITGYAEGTFIDAEREEEGFKKYVGSLGDVCRSRNLNRTGKITLTLMASAASNDLLSAFYAEDELLGTGFGSLSIKDLNGLTRVHCAEAWISKLPKIERAKDAGTAVWVFECADIEIVAGGNLTIVNPF